jgi:hypothetical protein
VRAPVDGARRRQEAPTVLTFHGSWRITVIGKSADFDQRLVVRTDYGDRVLPGRVGATLDVDAECWRLSLEHHLWGRSWQPNLRTVPGPVTEHGGVRSRLLTSNDCQWPGKPLDYPNLVVRLDQVLAGRPAAAAEAGSAPLSAPIQSVRTSSAVDYALPARPASAPALPSSPARPASTPASRRSAPATW